MLTYQCFISCWHNWQLVYTHCTYGVAIQGIKKHTKPNFMLCIGHLHLLGLVPKFKAKTVTSGLLVWPCHSLIPLYLMLTLLDLVVDLHGSGSDWSSSVEAQCEVLSLSCYQPSIHTSVFQVMCYLVILVGLFVLQVLCNMI